MKKTVSFRIEENDLIELERDATKRLITTNQLVNQIINNYLMWKRHIRKLKFIPISDELLRQFFQKTIDKKDLPIVVYSIIKDITLRAFKDFEFDYFVNIIKAYCIECGFQIDDRKDDNERRIVINHTLGTEFSCIISQIFEIAFSEFNMVHKKYVQSPNTLLIQIAMMRKH